MAQVNLTANTYAGKRYAEYFTPAMLQEKGLANNNLVTLIEGYKSKAVMTTTDITIDLKNKTSLFAAQTPALQRGEKVMDLIDYSANIQLDYLPVAKSWEALNMQAGSLNDYEPRDLYDFTVNQLLVPKLGKLNEQLYILGKGGVSANGVATFDSDYAGILGKFEAGSDVNKFPIGGVASATQVTGAIVNGTVGTATVAVASGAAFKAGDQITISAADGNQQINATTIVGQTVTVRGIAGNVLTINEVVTGSSASTAGVVQFINLSNVIEVLTYTYGLIPETERLKDDTRIFIPTQVEKFYRLANADVANGNGNYYRQDEFGQSGIPFLDMRMESMPFWLPNTIAVWNPGNVFLAVDLISDEVSANITWMGDVTNDMVYRFRNDMKSQIDYLFGSQILYVRPA
jgi:hypothetical protein